MDGPESYHTPCTAMVVGTAIGVLAGCSQRVDMALDGIVKANDIDASRVTIENIGFPIREPMLAAGKVDAITGYSFSSFINLKAKGVGDEDISLIRMRRRPLAACSGGVARSRRRVHVSSHN